jgi:hypothetical protein
MCWNAEASITAFVLGVVAILLVCAYSIPRGHRPLTVLSLGWLWVITMQLWEYFVWTKAGNWASIGAYFFNMTQILVLFLVFLCFGDPKPPAPQIISAAMIVFVTTVVLFLPTEVVVRASASPEKHLQYSWWSPRFKSTLYLIGLGAVFLLMVRPLSWSVSCLAVLYLMLLVSALFYSDAVASIWCFFAVPFPLIAWALYSIKHNG